MAAEDYFDPYDEPPDDDDARPVTCKRCGRGNLFWEQYQDEQRNWRWRLIDKNEEPHTCGQASPAEFPIEALD